MSERSFASAFDSLTKTSERNKEDEQEQDGGGLWSFASSIATGSARAALDAVTDSVSTVSELLQEEDGGPTTSGKIVNRPMLVESPDAIATRTDTTSAPTQHLLRVLAQENDDTVAGTTNSSSLALDVDVGDEAGWGDEDDDLLDLGGDQPESAEPSPSPSPRRAAPPRLADALSRAETEGDAAAAAAGWLDDESDELDFDVEGDDEEDVAGAESTQSPVLPPRTRTPQPTSDPTPDPQPERSPDPLPQPSSDASPEPTTTRHPTRAPIAPDSPATSAAEEGSSWIGSFVDPKRLNSAARATFGTFEKVGQVAFSQLSQQRTAMRAARAGPPGADTAAAVVGHVGGSASVGGTPVADAAHVPPSTDVSSSFRAVLESFGPETTAEVNKMSLFAGARLRLACTAMGPDAVQRARVAGCIDVDAPQATEPTFAAAPPAIASAITSFPREAPSTLSASDAGATLARASIAAQHVAHQLLRGFLSCLTLPTAEPVVALDTVSLDRCTVLVAEARACLSYLAFLLTALTTSLADRLVVNKAEVRPTDEVVDVYVTSEVVRYSILRHATALSQIAAAALVVE